MEPPASHAESLRDEQTAKISAPPRVAGRPRRSRRSGAVAPALGGDDRELNCEEGAALVNATSAARLRRAGWLRVWWPDDVACRSMWVSVRPRYLSNRSGGRIRRSVSSSLGSSSLCLPERLNGVPWRLTPRITDRTSGACYRGAYGASGASASTTGERRGRRPIAARDASRLRECRESCQAQRLHLRRESANSARRTHRPSLQRRRPSRGFNPLMARTALSAAASSSSASCADSVSWRRSLADNNVTVCSEFASSSIVFLMPSVMIEWCY